MIREDIRRTIGLLFTVVAGLFIAYLLLDIVVQSVLMLGLVSMPEMVDSASHHFGQWSILVGSIVILSFFTLAYVVPLGKRNWRSAGLVQGFIIALFTEMYGFPLTVYIIASLLGKPLSDPGHVDGHLLARIVGRVSGLAPDAAASAIMVFSSSVMVVGFLLILFGWRRIYGAQGRLVTDGIYHYVRHPQYTGILLITLSLLIHWPTIVTALMWPILFYTYYRLARREERMAKEAFGDEYQNYRRRTPMFLPRFRAHVHSDEDAVDPAPHLGASIQVSVRTFPIRALIWPAAIGISAAILLAALYILVLGFTQDFGHAIELVMQDWYFVIPIAVGFGIQVGLFAYIRRVLKLRKGARSATTLTGAGTGTSTVSMVACCAHHLADALPMLGLSGAAVFLNDNRGPFMALGIVTNFVGIVMMVRMIRRIGVQPSQTE